ncbi:MAG: type II toxin-antitoxin system VapC family toxin [Desulfobacterales bacterium]|nr:type II toxin-antitoxin system VapC family toxin [Desulfobacterales bacterium]
MKAILLDTHIFLWWLFDDPGLPGQIRDFVRNTEHEVHVSAASVWEIATKFRLGKLPQAALVAKNVPFWIQRAGFGAMPITAAHAQIAGAWDVAHRDPFDRLLAAQAKLEKMSLASVDEAMTLFPIEVFNG